MTPQTFIFIGRSGAGKGTQVKLLQDVLKEKDPSGEILYIETGANFRKFFEGDKYSNKISREIYDKGLRQPDFIAIWMWAKILLEDLKNNEHVILDGIARSLPEAMTLTTAIEFYDRKVTVVYLNVSRTWSMEKLLSRKRSDDNMVEINERLDWFERDTLPAIEYFNIHDRYTLLDINGEQPIEKVHAEIIEKLHWQ